MWAMMPILRMRSSAMFLGTALKPLSETTTCLSIRKQVERAPGPGSRELLPAIVSEGLVGLRHAMRVFALLDRPALVARRGQNLRGELLVHGLVGPLASERDEPADGQGVAAVRTDLHGHLVIRSAHPPRLDLEHGLHVVHGGLEHRHRLLTALLLDHLHGLVEDA